jgi:polyferredoxin
MILFRFPLFLAAFFLTGFAADLLAVPRNPPPVFETDYSLPAAETPAPFYSLAAENYTAVGLYTLFLILAGLAVHRWRSRRILFLLSIAAVILFGFVRQGCPCPVGMFQNITNALVQPVAVLSWTCIALFTFPLVAALFWGRIFCSAVCPLGAVQELTAIKNLPVDDRTEHVFGLFRFLWLGVGVFCVVVGLGYEVCRFDPFVGFFRLNGLYHVLIFGGLMLFTGFFIGRPFCRFMCPYGALLGLCGSLARQKVSVTPGECTQCQLCKHVCPYNAILPPTVEPAPLERRYGPLKLLGTIAALPLFIVLFAAIGYTVAPLFAPLHNDVRTAQLLYAEDEKLVETSGTFSETRAMMQAGKQADEVYRQALTVFDHFRRAGLMLGGWIGLVIGVKWITLSVRRRRTDYEVDPARCFACGRCFWYCPNQKENRLLLIEK